MTLHFVATKKRGKRVLHYMHRFIESLFNCPTIFSDVEKDQTPDIPKIAPIHP